jgi:hypothetical protein
MDLLVVNSKQLLKTTFDMHGNRVITIEGDVKRIDWGEFICEYLNNKDIGASKEQIKAIKKILC